MASSDCNLADQFVTEVKQRGHHSQSATRSRSHEKKLKTDLDFGEVQVRSRTRWWMIWIPSGTPPPPSKSLSSAPDISLSTASMFSILTYSWITPMMTLGYQRTLQVTDLGKLDNSYSSEHLSTRFDQSWERRKRDADTWNAALQQGAISPDFFRRLVLAIRSITAGTNCANAYIILERKWREVDGRKNASLALALNDTVGVLFWRGALFKVMRDMSQLMGPLMIKAIIQFAQKRESAKEHNSSEPNVGVGIAMAVGLFLLTLSASIGQNQFFWRTMVAGMLARAALIRSMYTRGIKLTRKARTQITNSDLINHITTDVSRIDACAQWFHASWTVPIQIVICLIILLFQLGPSALAGFSLFVAIVPLQERAMAQQFTTRKQSAKYTDKRAKTLLEVIGSIRVVKYFSYEVPFLHRIYAVRANELQGVRRILMFQSANVAFAFSIPALAATLSFITYTHLKSEFDVAVIFASFSLFQLLRQPMMFLPRALSAISDARSALSRLQCVFDAETRDVHSSTIDRGSEWAICVENATFEWEESPKIEGRNSSSPSAPLAPFNLEGINLRVPRGSLVAMVGRVGSGKSSLLSGIVGEMKKVSGSVVFGGQVAYCPQLAWIQNASVRDNITFGQRFDEDRYLKVIEQASLQHDLQLLADGDLTEIGEKGVNLSGGQKQRISIARALYYNADVVIMDDPLSAVDAHVGKSLFHDAIVGALRNQGKSVILVTHALHFLSRCDYIYMLRDGRVAEHGTYRELVDANGEFSRLDREFGEKHSHHAQEITEVVNSSKSVDIQPISSNSGGAGGAGTLEGKLIVNEQRSTGSISKAVYKAWFVAGRGWFTAPLLVLSLVLMQGSLLISSYTLVWWQANSFNRPFSFYQILYAVLGISQTITAFLSGCCTDAFSYFVSKNLHRDAITSIFYAPMAFFDTTPIGRIMGIFGKDLDNMDNQLSASFRSFTMSIGIVAGAIVIISIVEHYFVIAAVVIYFGYQYFAAFYRASAREVKRIDSMLRSLLYSHFAESLTGVPTLRTYGEVPRFRDENAYYIDLENRALILTITNQRWLSVRLDFCGGLLVFFVALLAVTGASGASAAKVGLILTYTISLTQACGMLIRQTTEVENNLNSVERIVHYSLAEHMNQEAPHEIPEEKPADDWPSTGAIEFVDVSMKYRPGLPNVLHNISMSIRGGEKIGVVGRTGAGKSSLTLALLRIVEYAGKITIDGVDISKIGLKDLRTRIAIIPQEPTIFSGTVRAALDPFSQYDDAHLWGALRRSFLVENANPQSSGRINLDTEIEQEGSNLSVGERSLLSLARALVRQTKVVILDEATASVDLETDKKIQHTIKTEFKDRTLICIAHRLRTILSYDRILVLDGGNIVEFDTPLVLFRDTDGKFRGLCDNSGIIERDFLA